MTRQGRRGERRGRHHRQDGRLPVHPGQRQVRLQDGAAEPLTDVANTEKKVPLEWINKEHNGVEQPFIDYVLPLIQGEPNAAQGGFPAPLRQAEEGSGKVSLPFRIVKRSRLMDTPSGG